MLIRFRTTGLVAVQVKRGRRTISTRRVRVERGCTFRDLRRLGSGRLRVIARWLGNDVLAPRSAPTMSVRAR